jgi:hypothetical protein
MRCLAIVCLLAGAARAGATVGFGFVGGWEFRPRGNERTLPGLGFAATAGWCTSRFCGELEYLDLGFEYAHGAFPDAQHVAAVARPILGSGSYLAGSCHSCRGRQRGAPVLNRWRATVDLGLGERWGTDRGRDVSIGVSFDSAVKMSVRYLRVSSDGMGRSPQALLFEFSWWFAPHPGP